MKIAVPALAFLALPLAAHAADLPSAAPLPAVFTWNGLYTGTFMGYGAVNGHADPICQTAGFAACIDLPGGRRPDASGLAAGTEVGYNFQLPMGLVLGLEGDYQFTRIRSVSETDGATSPFGALTPPWGSVSHIGQSLDDLATVRGRVGYGFGDTLVFATGGLAVGRVRLDATRSDDLTLPQGNFAIDNTASRSDWRLGYIVGGGVEQALTSRLSVKVEGDYFDLGSRTVAALDTIPLVPNSSSGLYRGARVKTDGYLVRAGLNYRFGDGLPFMDALRGAIDPAGDPSPAYAQWGFQTGLRYFYSSGGHKYDLHDPFDHAQLNSRLTYDGLATHAAESFARLDHYPTGLFVKGFLGSGTTVSGHLHDEDFPPGTVPYSNTLSSVQDGSVSYANVDVGYDFWRDEAVRMGAFVGYSYLGDTMNAYGCGQVGGGDVCTPAVPGTVKVLSENAAWNALRIGGVVEGQLDRFHATFDAAYLPIVELSGYDQHWLRPDINSLSQTGSGDGYQLEMVVSYDVTRNLSIGAGGRYWTMQARGNTFFPGYPASPIKTETERYGGFLQSAYRFDQ